MTTYLSSRPVRATLIWQAVATLGVALVAGAWVGIDGAISAVLGGLITIVAGLAFAIVVSIRKPLSPDSTVITMFAAEAVKIGAIILLLWAVITAYSELQAAAFFTAFVITVFLNRVAFWVPSVHADGPDTEWK